ncbi:MAG: hypothetical protein AAB596_01865 [Patescibacteria group bacterium]
MKQLPKFIIFVTIFLLLAGATYFYGFENFYSAEAQVSGNVLSGWMWSSNIGWVSVNCEDRGVCASSDYKVSIVPASGGKEELRGYAWSSNIGWINFNPVGPYPENPNTPVVIDVATGDISGWLRACNVFASGCSGALKNNLERGDWNGWIKITDAKLISNKIDDSLGAGTSYGGWAWGADVVGWLNFSNVVKTISSLPLPPPPPPVAPGDRIEVPSR